MTRKENIENEKKSVQPVHAASFKGSSMGVGDWVLQDETLKLKTKRSLEKAIAFLLRQELSLWLGGSLIHDEA